ncbi:hypothetical protein OF83DRAFT_1273023, partial [Amylostereum chailletii]
MNDSALVEKWKGDMDGLLIFVIPKQFQQAGLFSAVVTAFLVESIPLLQQDTDQTSTVTSAFARSRDHKQLTRNDTTQRDHDITPLPLLQSTTSSGSPLRLNVLWILSLFLSLLCALSATLVQQWARGYKQAVERRSAPFQRAVIRIFLYNGIESSGVKAVAAAIPTLLHIAVFLFVGGMYDFLISSNRVVAFLSIGALCVFVGTYLALSVIPLGDLSSPYQTPLSSALWALRKIVISSARLGNSGTPTPRNMVHGREQAAMSVFKNPRTQERVVDALAGTLETFTEDDELEGFIEGIPNLLASRQPELSNAPSIIRDLVERANLGIRIVQLLQ